MTQLEIDSRLRRLPPIRRARLWRFYAQDGRRFLDLYQGGGRGVLGARQGNLGTSLKASLDRGLDRALPSHFEARFVKFALARWPRAKALRIYASEEAALSALEGLFGRGSSPTRRQASLSEGALLRDPLARRGFEGLEGEPRALLLRPFASHRPPPSWPHEAMVADPRFEPTSFDIALPLLPLARGLGPGLLLFADPALAEKAPPSELLPPLLLAAALEALEALSRYETALGENQWKRIDRRLGDLFERRGPWLFPRLSGEEYEGLFMAALAKGLLLNPDHDRPSLIPGDFDDGELACLTTLSLPSVGLSPST